MGRVRATVRVPARVDDVRALWFDLDRWPSFVDGFARVVEVDAEWPRGGRILWKSHPGGRGRVQERVTSFSDAGQEIEVEDASLKGMQEIAFAEVKPDRVDVLLGLTYRLNERSPITPLVDVLFIRRALRDSLRRTLTGFAAEVRSANVQRSGQMNDFTSAELSG